jgi:hypothetical protein
MKSRSSSSGVATIGMYASAGYLGWRALPLIAEAATYSVRVPFNLLCNLITSTDFETSDFLLDSTALTVLGATILLKSVNMLSESSQDQAAENAPQVSRLS